MRIFDFRFSIFDIVMGWGEEGIGRGLGGGEEDGGFGLGRRWFFDEGRRAGVVSMWWDFEEGGLGPMKVC